MSCVTRARVYTKDTGENELAPTRLNAPIPNDIPPWRCSWLGPLRLCRDLTRACSSLCEMVGKRAKHEWLYNTDLATNNPIGVRVFLLIVSEFCAFLMFLQQKAKHLSPRKHTHKKLLFIITSFRQKPPAEPVFFKQPNEIRVGISVLSL